MSIWQQLLLAIVQGLTEFLPISSSAHLILASQVLGWPDQGLAFDTAVHLGTLAAVLFYFRRDLHAMLLALADPQAVQQRRLIALLGLASLPALLVGYWSADLIAQYLRTPAVIIITTLIFALLLWQADRWGRRRRSIAQLRWRDALVIGGLQVLALIPGTSRAGITITAGLWLGMERAAAARFSFLLAIPVLSGAGLYSLLQLMDAESPFNGGAFLLAAAVAAGMALATVHWFVDFVERVGLLPFVIYRLLLGSALLLLYLFAPF